MLQRIVTLMTAALITGGAFSLRADMSGKIEVNIPFDFAVGAKAYKAGSYSLIAVHPGVLTLRDGTGAGQSFLMTSSVVDDSRAGKKAALVFNRYGTKHYLSQVWSGRSNSGRQLPMSAAEREQLVKIPSRATVEVASSTR